MRIDADLPEAYLSMGIVSFFYDRDWQRAEQEFKQSIELNPADALDKGVKLLNAMTNPEYVRPQAVEPQNRLDGPRRIIQAC